MAGLWVHGDGNQNYFPIIRLTQPMMEEKSIDIHSLEDTDITKRRQSTTERKKRLLQRLEHAQPNNINKDTHNLFDRLGDKARNLAVIFNGENQEIVQVCSAFTHSISIDSKGEITQSIPFWEMLRIKAMEWANKCNDISELDALEVLLFTASSESGKKKVQLALDVDDMRSIYQSDIRKKVIATLRRKDKNSSNVSLLQTNGSFNRCAYTGTTDLWDKPFPSVKLPVFGKGFSIFSMFSAAECNLRYGLKDHEIIPVAKEIVLNMQDSLNEIVRPERKGSTWRSIPSEKPGPPDQLIVYVDGRPNIPIQVADFFGESDDTCNRQFAADASTICDALSGIQREKPDSRLNLIILRKASDGQAFVALAESPTIEEVLRGADWWQRAARNVPLGTNDKDEYAISLPVLNEVNNFVHLKPSALYPGQMAALLIQVRLAKRNNHEKEKGTKSSYTLRGIAFSQVLDIMLQKPNKAEMAAHIVLSLIIAHFGSFLMRISEWQNKGGFRNFEDFDTRDRLSALRAVSIIGLSLYALNSKKEDYMHKAAFQIGRVLALADRLHRCYCTVVRDGAMPSNLIGNAVFDTALSCPEKALAILAQRFRIYLGWAESVRPDTYPDSVEKQPKQKHIAVLEAKKILRQYKVLAEELHQQGLPLQCNDVMKAHLLLGYLAGEESLGTEGVDK